MKHTKKALLLSCISLMLCMSMLIGTTFAWFTDTATTGVNTIVAGNLDIDIVDANGDSLEGRSLGFVKEDGSAITDAILWEPGCRYLLQPATLVNKGSLWVKYTVVISGYTAPADGSADLADVIDVYEGETYLGTLSQVLTQGVLVEESTLAPKGEAGASAQFGALKLVMQESAGNDYMNKSISGVSIAVYAAQLNAEIDSFGPDYDKEATSTYVSKAEQLKGALESGGDIVMAVDAALSEEIVITNDTTLDLQGNALTVSEEKQLTVADGATLTIANGSLNVGGNNADADAIVVSNNAEGTTTVLKLENVNLNFIAHDYTDEDGKVYENQATSIVASAEEGAVEVIIGEGTNITFEGAQYNAPVYVGKNATVTMDGGVITANNTFAPNSGATPYGVMLDDDTAVFNMNGGVINVEGTGGSSGITAYAGTVNFNGGVINVTGGNAGMTYNYYIGIETWGTTTLNLNGGTIYVKSPGAYGAEAIDISSKTTVNFNAAASTLVVNIYKSIWDGNCLSEDDSVNALGIKVNNIYPSVTEVEDLQEALQNQDSITVDVGNDKTISDTVTVPEGKDLTIDSGKIDASGNHGVAVSAGKDTTVNLNDGTYKAFEDAHVIDAQTKGAEVIVNGGTYEGDYLTFIAADAKLTVNGGTLATAADPTEVIVVSTDDSNTAIVTINGGTFYSKAICDNGVKISITGGTFYLDGLTNTPVMTDYLSGYISITGGSFNIDPSAWVADGYAAVQGADNMWTVSAE